MGVSQSERKGAFVLDVSEPKYVDDATMAFPANVVGTFLPFYDDIPEDFKGYKPNHWIKTAEKWFFSGLQSELSKPKAGIDRSKALRHLSTCIRSYQPSHEHKMAGLAYLMSLWFEEVSA